MSEWISIDVAVPHHEIRVLTVRDDGWMSIDYGKNLTDYRHTMQTKGLKSPVTHWMPLPATPGAPQQ